MFVFSKVDQLTSRDGKVSVTRPALSSHFEVIRVGCIFWPSLKISVFFPVWVLNRFLSAVRLSLLVPRPPPLFLSYSLISKVRLNPSLVLFLHPRLQNPALLHVPDCQGCPVLTQKINCWTGTTEIKFCSKVHDQQVSLGLSEFTKGGIGIGQEMDFERQLFPEIMKDKST